MEKTNKIPQIYGYVICVIAVITFLISLTQLIEAYIDKGDPLHTNSYNLNENLASFEVYRMSILKQTKSTGESTAGNYIPDNEEIKAMYKAELDQKITTANHENKRARIVNGFLVILCLVLFTTHWIWLRNLAKKE